MPLKKRPFFLSPRNRSIKSCLSEALIAGDRNGVRITLIKLPYIGNKAALPHRVSGRIRFVVETKTMPRARF